MPFHIMVSPFNLITKPFVSRGSSRESPDLEISFLSQIASPELDIMTTSDKISLLLNLTEI